MRKDGRKGGRKEDGRWKMEGSDRRKKEPPLLLQLPKLAG